MFSTKHILFAFLAAFALLQFYASARNMRRKFSNHIKNVLKSVAWRSTVGKLIGNFNNYNETDIIRQFDDGRVQLIGLPINAFVAVCEHIIRSWPRRGTLVFPDESISNLSLPIFRRFGCMINILDPSSEAAGPAVIPIVTLSRAKAAFDAFFGL